MHVFANPVTYIYIYIYIYMYLHSMYHQYRMQAAATLYYGDHQFRKLAATSVKTHVIEYLTHCQIRRLCDHDTL